MKELGEDFIDNYNWKLYPEAEDFLWFHVNDFLRNNFFARKLATKMKRETSTEIFDWIDHMILPDVIVSEKKLLDVGYKEISLETPKGMRAFKIPGSILFPILLSKRGEIELALKPENIEDCVKKLAARGEMEGTKLGPYRRAVIRREGKYILTAVERRGSNEFVVKNFKDEKDYKRAFEEFLRRKRTYEGDAKGMEETKRLVMKWLKKLSNGRVADAFFRAERTYWQSKNMAGKTQHARQNKLGLGWGNHDHHTYRSSREHFKELIKIFEIMGYECRERFYAGEKAGWGAQILEHGQCDIVLFADVDITSDEKNMDFAHQGLKNQKHLGTVGLWIGLHGESILQAGMHHLEARFNFENLRRDLKKEGIITMKPFSDFQFLRQAFTEGERWKVKKERLDTLLKRGSITKEQHYDFLRKGAIGSHMENLQRRQGYKGFNQTSVTAIIKETNPIKQLEEHHKGA